MKHILKQMGSIPDLTLNEELYEMFKITHHQMGKTLPTDNIKQLVNYLGSMSYTYTSFLDTVNEKVLTNVSDSEKIQYLFNFNYQTGKVLEALLELTLEYKMNNHDIVIGYEGLGNDFQYNDFIYETHPIRTLMEFSRFVNIRYHHVYNNPEVNLRPIVSIKSENDFSLGLNEHFFTGGKIINESYLIAYNKKVVDILMCLSQIGLAIDNLEFEKDNIFFKRRILNLWVVVFNLLDLLGHNWDSVQRLFTVTINIKLEEDGK